MNLRPSRSILNKIKTFKKKENIYIKILIFSLIPGMEIFIISINSYIFSQHSIHYFCHLVEQHSESSAGELSPSSGGRSEKESLAWNHKNEWAKHCHGDEILINYWFHRKLSVMRERKPTWEKNHFRIFPWQHPKPHHSGLWYGNGKCGRVWKIKENWEFSVHIVLVFFTFPGIVWHSK